MVRSSSGRLQAYLTGHLRLSFCPFAITSSSRRPCRPLPLRLLLGFISSVGVVSFVLAIDSGKPFVVLSRLVPARFDNRESDRRSTQMDEIRRGRTASRLRTFKYDSLANDHGSICSEPTMSSKKAQSSSVGPLFFWSCRKDSLSARAARVIAVCIRLLPFHRPVRYLAIYCEEGAPFPDHVT